MDRPTDWETGKTRKMVDLKFRIKARMLLNGFLELRCLVHSQETATASAVGLFCYVLLLGCLLSLANGACTQRQRPRRGGPPV